MVVHVPSARNISGVYVASVPPFNPHKKTMASNTIINMRRSLSLFSNEYMLKLVRLPVPYPRDLMLSAVMMPPSKAQLVSAETMVSPSSAFCILLSESPPLPMHLRAPAI